MAILNTTNDKLLSLITTLTKNTSNYVIKEIPKLNNSNILVRSDALIESILYNYYMKKYTLLKKNTETLKGYIVPKPNSILNFVDLDKYSNDLQNFNLLPFNEKLIRNFQNRVKEEVATYLNDIESVKNNISLIKQHINTNKEKDIKDMFVLNIIREIDIYDVMEDKGWLNSMVIPTKNYMFNDITDILVNEIANDPFNIITDAEINLLLNDNINALNIDKDEIKSMINTYLNNVDLNDLKQKLVSIKYKDINTLIVLVAKLTDYIKKSSNKDNYETLTAIKNTVIEKLKSLKQYGEVSEKIGRVIGSFTKTNDEFTLNVIGTVYDKFMEEVKSLNVLIGGFIKEYEIKKTGIYDGVEYTIFISLNDLMANKTKYAAIADAYNKSTILEKQNNNRLKLQTYYMFTILDNLPKDTNDIDTEIIKEYIQNLPLVKLLDIDNSVLEIYKNFIYKNSNFAIFVDATNEATKVMGKTADIRDIVGYAILKLVCYYFADQTEIK